MIDQFYMARKLFQVIFWRGSILGRTNFRLSGTPLSDNIYFSRFCNINNGDAKVD
jgi:hypothetical protein